MLSLDDIKAVDDLPCSVVHVDEWGGDVKVRAMSAKDRIDFEKSNSTAKTELETMIYLIMYSCVKDDGSKLFDKDAYDFLASKSANALIKIFQAAVSLSTLNKEGMEERAKNS